MSTGESAVAEPAGEEAPGAESVASSVQPLDFSQPTKFTPELRRRIDRVIGAFCKATSLRLSSELGVPVELARTSASQLSWSAARASVSQEPLLGALTVDPIGGEMLVTLELPLVLRALCCMLGGSPAKAPVQRKLSEIDWALARRFLDVITWQLSLVWRDLGGLELALREVDVEGDAGLFVPSGEPTLSIRLECVVADTSAELCVLLPWSAIEPVANQILDRGGTVDGEDPEQTRALEEGLARAKTLVRAEIGTAMVPVHEVLSLAPGSLLTLDAKAESGVRLMVHHVTLARGMPGRSGARKAVKLTSPIQPQSDSSPTPLATPLAAAAAKVRSAAEPLAGRINQLRAVDLHVWAELGSVELALSNALRLPQGSVLELDQNAEDPVALFVNGVPFASGELVVTDDAQWAVQVGALS